MTMPSVDDPPRSRALAFARAHGFHLVDRLGFGQDGEVYRSSLPTAVKVFHDEALFVAEWEAYVRLEEAGVTSAAGHAVPALLQTDFNLLLLHLDMVFPPFVLDFARVSLDERSENRWPAHVWAERMAEWEKRFHPHQWPKVIEVREALGAAAGVWIEDLHQGNIRFADSDEVGDTSSSG